MFAKRLLHKVKPQNNAHHGSITDLELQVVLHYGIPYTASILAFDPIQRLLAIGTLDGRIKIIGGDNIEGLLISPKKLPYKNIEFIHNQGFLLGILNDNDIQVWDLECRRLTYSLQWEDNITAFAIIQGTNLMYIGDDNGLVSVLKYDSEEGKLVRLPYNIPVKAITDSVGISFPNHAQIVGILPQPCSSGSRVLIAYDNGLIILWDVSEGHVVTVRGYTELQLKGDGSDNLVTEVSSEVRDSSLDLVQEEKEICSLCWASNSGTVLAVGYINGDILLWDVSSEKGQQTGVSSKTAVKLQLASGNRRLPIIVLCWSSNHKSHDGGGQLLIYGGDDMGSEEVLTVLNLDWSSGIDSLRCISRVDLQLTGSFADIILIPNAGSIENNSTAALFVLTNPGQLSVYDGAILPILKPEEGKVSAQAKFPVVVPTIDPYITVTKLCLLPMAESSFKDFLKKSCTKRDATVPILSAGAKWPLTGGVPNESFSYEEKGVERIYISGYQDGSVRIWDATCPILRIMFLLEGKVPGIEVDFQNASVSALDFCPLSMAMAVGNECGLVHVYKIQESSSGSSYHIVSETKHEVHIIQHGDGYSCIATFIFTNSPVTTLYFTNGGGKLVVGFESGQVAMLDMSSLSIIFCNDHISAARSPVISIARHVYPQISAQMSSPKKPNTDNPKNSADGVMVILTKDAHIIVLDSITGKIISSLSVQTKKDTAAISMYVIDESNDDTKITGEKCPQDLPNDKSTQRDSPKSPKKDDHSESERTKELEDQSCSFVPQSNKLLSDPHLLLCCEDALLLCSLNSVVEGSINIIRKMHLVKHCCWCATFRKKSEKTRGLILLYQTGDIEMRSLPELEVLAESSLMSVLRWNFKTNMEKTMSFYDNGQISLVNGCEIAFLSLLACGDEFRFPESLPSLHDKVLAAAADAAISISANQKKKQGTAHGILGGIMKGLKGEHSAELGKSSFTILEEYFLKDPFIAPSATTIGDGEVELSIDDVEIDDSLPIAPASPRIERKSKTKEKEREKLFHGATNDAKPRVRSTQEIMTQYRFGGDASAAAAHAKEKLVERQEKLERISRNTEELQNEAANFADMAHELAKAMEKKKWWKI